MEWPTTPISLVLFAFIGLFELALVDALYRTSRIQVRAAPVALPGQNVTIICPIVIEAG